MNKSEYLKNPCGMSSIPFWKTESIITPYGITIVHNDDYISSDHKDELDEPYFRLYHSLTNLTEPILPAGYSLYEASICEYVNHINSCYRDIHITEHELNNYKNIFVVSNIAL